MKGIIKHDWQSGIVGNWKQIIVFAVVFYICSVFTVANARGGNIENVSFFENLVYVMQGCIPCSQEMEFGSHFVIPTKWMILQIIVAYIVADYPVYDLKTYGINLLVQTKSKTKWWIGKVIWTIEIVCALYIVGYCMIELVTIFAEGDFFTVRESAGFFLHNDYSVFNRFGLCLIGMVLPIIASVTISLIELLLLFAFNNVVAYAVVFFFLIASVFYENPIWIFGNGMSIRSVNRLLDGTYVTELIGMGMVCILISLCGCILIRKKDIL
ncbi:hypothetical protein [Agathobacter ruminis]|uniref:Uncharacterized protein n=1 Tax=Agathobacter ruminis TaxID=1712665 RepID=A0A2G3E3X6_9FIRM|nr:hypothetical protein [Agathobacter ruminis]MDC7302254.1 hypothetical protein [Agathobacter ruminis]PHU37901.1 hypothetical protein CSX02_05520 [Agathobacter ruminis]